MIKEAEYTSSIRSPYVDVKLLSCQQAHNMASLTMISGDPPTMVYAQIKNSTCFLLVYFLRLPYRQEANAIVLSFQQFLLRHLDLQCMK